jgi:hypothetical protein
MNEATHKVELRANISFAGFRLIFRFRLDIYSCTSVAEKGHLWKETN